MRIRQTLISTAATALFILVSQASAQEKHCKLWPEGGLLAHTYELVGPEACKIACTETDGCTAWSYQPHNFNPKSSPGECRLMAAVSEEEENPKDFCGRL